MQEDENNPVQLVSQGTSITRKNSLDLPPPLRIVLPYVLIKKRPIRRFPNQSDYYQPRRDGIQSRPQSTCNREMVRGRGIHLLRVGRSRSSSRIRFQPDAQLCAELESAYSKSTFRNNAKTPETELKNKPKTIKLGFGKQPIKKSLEACPWDSLSKGFELMRFLSGFQRKISAETSLPDTSVSTEPETKATKLLISLSIPQTSESNVDLSFDSVRKEKEPKRRKPRISSVRESIRRQIDNAEMNTSNSYFSPVKFERQASDSAMSQDLRKSVYRTARKRSVRM